MLRVSTVRTWGYGFCMVIVPLRWVSVRARDALGFRLGRTIDASRTEQWMEGMRKKRELPLFWEWRRRYGNGGRLVLDLTCTS